MAEYPNTPILGLKRPIVGTGQQWSTQKYIVDNFNAIEDFASDTNIRLGKTEQYLRGSSAARDTFWGTPSTPGDRVALAEKRPTWFNFEKGYEEQYFAKFDDAGVDADTPVRSNFGWAPKQGVGLVPLRGGTPTAEGAGTLVAQGGKYVFTNGAGGFRLSNILTPDFEAYRIIMNFASASAGVDVGFNLVAAGVVFGATAWGRNTNDVNSAGTVSAGAASAQPTVTVGRSETTGSVIDMIAYNAAQALPKYVLSSCMDRGNNRRLAGGNTSTTTVADGIEFRFTGGVTVNGNFRIYGINEL